MILLSMLYLLLSWSNILICNKGQIVPAANKLFTAEEEERDEEIHEQMIPIENELKRLENLVGDHIILLGGDRLGHLDIVAYISFSEFLISREVTQIDLIDVEKFPAIAQWMGMLDMMSTITLYCRPSEDEHVAYIRARIEAAKSAAK
eukprot:XP_025015648.1 glutathione S-transferase U7-like [Ricinus communis]